MEKDDIKQCLTSALGIMERVTFLIHHLRELEEKVNAVKEPVFLPRSIPKQTYHQPLIKKTVTGRRLNLGTPGYAAVLTMLKEHPASWTELVVEGQKRKATKYMITNAIGHLRDAGMIVKEGHKWRLVE